MLVGHLPGNAATSGSSPNRLLFALVVAEMASSFEAGMIFSALATMYRVFQDPVGVGWLVTAFMLVSAAAAAICGRLGDLYGRQQMMIVMLVLATAGSLVSAMSSSLGGVVLGRALQGASSAVLPLCFGIVREHLPPSRIPVGVSYLTSMAAFGAGLGVFVAGVIVDHFTWQWMFYVSAGQAVAGLALVLMFVPRSRPQRPAGRIDIVGGILFAPAIALVLFAISYGKAWGWMDLRTLGTLAAGVALLVYWVRYELRHEQPLIDVRLFGNRQIALTNIDMALFGFGPSQLMLILLLLLQQPAWTGVGLGISATLAALVKLPGNVLALIFGPWSGHIAARHGGRRAMLYGVLLVLFAWLAMTLHHGSVTFLFAMILVASAAGAMMYAAIPNLIIEVSPTDRTSETTGVSSVVRTASSAVGAQVVTFLLATSTVADPSGGKAVFPSGTAYLLAFAAVTLSLALMVVVTYALPRRKPVPVATTQPA